MARKIKSGYLGYVGKSLSPEETLWTYCGFDNGVTHEIHGVLKPQLDPETTGKIYKFECDLQGPVLAMMLRGFRIDRTAVQKALHGDPLATYGEEEVGPRLKYESHDEAETETKRRRLGLYARLRTLGGMHKDSERKTNKWQVDNPEALLQALAHAVWEKPLNYHSPKQIQEFLYGALRLPEQTKVEKGKVRVITDGEALEFLGRNYPRSTLICKTILMLRSIEKLIEVLEKGIDEDGRMRCSFHIAGTETGRMSSSSSVWDTGGNLQNITPELRRIFVPDPGKVLVNVDLEQAESRAVAYLAGDQAYIEACESADLHTTVASMLFGIPNTRKDAERPYYRHFSYRDMAKRAGHGLNYGLSPAALAMNMHITQKQAWRVYMLYLGGELRGDQAAALSLHDLEHTKNSRWLVFPGAFPGIKRWHLSTKEELETGAILYTPFGRKRTFWGRPTDGSTAREAVAFRPQSLIADMLNTGMLRVHRELPEVQMLAQVHDSIAFQIDEKILDKIAPRVLELLKVEIKINKRTLVIPAEVKYGYNWRDLKKWTK